MVSQSKTKQSSFFEVYAFSESFINKDVTLQTQLCFNKYNLVLAGSRKLTQYCHSG